MSLRAFWKAVEQKIARAPAHELRAMVRALASRVARAERCRFVAELDERLEADQAGVVDGERLLPEVRALAVRIRAALAGLEPPAHAWEDADMGACAGLLEPLADLFDRVGAVFDDGRVALARAVYDELFAILEMENEMGVGIAPHQLPGFDLQGSRARYLRAAYEDTPAPERVETLYMELQRTGIRDAGSRPMLAELVGASARPLPDLPAFVDEWIACLRGEEGADADAWLREAVRRFRGASGLEELARTDGEAHPRVFVDWCAALAEEGDPRGVIAAAHAGLDSLPDRSPIRAELADYLDAAAGALGNASKQQIARWEALLAQPSLSRLLDLRDTATGRTGRTELMRDASQRLEALWKEARDRRAGAREDLSPRLVPEAVLAHAYLLAGCWEAARELASRCPVLGWSGGSAQGLTVACFLVGLSGLPAGALPVHLAELWTSQLEAGRHGPGPCPEGAGPRQVTHERIAGAYRESLEALWSSHADLSGYVDWSLEIANKRIHAILSGKHRQSYGQAAGLLMACCEHLQARGKNAQVASLFTRVRGSFSRHRAFQAELEAALSRAGELAR